MAEFVAAYNDELKRSAAEQRAQAGSRQRDRAALDRKIANLVDAISDGRASPAILAKLTELEAQRDQIGSQPDDNFPVFLRLRHCIPALPKPTRTAWRA